MRKTPLLLTLVVVALVAGSPAPHAATRGFTATGSPGSFEWSPTVHRIARGDRITWTNPTSGNHTVTAYGGNWSKSSSLGSGDSTDKRFRRAGTFRFRCAIATHSSLGADGVCSGMCGKVRVRR